MLNPPTTRIRSRRWFSWLPALVFAATASSLVHASTVLSVPDCRATVGDWGCALPAILRVLSVIAIILAVILVGVVVLVVKSYLRMKHEPILEEEDDENVDS